MQEDAGGIGDFLFLYSAQYRLGAQDLMCYFYNR